LASHPSSDWVWDRVNGVVGNFQENLGSGPHVLEIQAREDGASLDALVITNDPAYVPSGAPLELPVRRTQPHGQ
jgi:hypothetical protein